MCHPPRRQDASGAVVPCDLRPVSRRSIQRRAAAEGDAKTAHYFGSALAAGRESIREPDHSSELALGVEREAGGDTAEASPSTRRAAGTAAASAALNLGTMLEPPVRKMVSMASGREAGPSQAWTVATTVRSKPRWPARTCRAMSSGNPLDTSPSASAARSCADNAIFACSTATAILALPRLHNVDEPVDFVGLCRVPPDPAHVRHHLLRRAGSPGARSRAHDSACRHFLCLVLVGLPKPSSGISVSRLSCRSKSVPPIWMPPWRMSSCARLPAPLRRHADHRKIRGAAADVDDQDELFAVHARS